MMNPLIIDMDDLDADEVIALNLGTNNGFGPIPEKRKKRATFLSAALSFVIMVVLNGGFTQRSKSKLYVVNTSNKTGQEDKMTCERSVEYYHVGVFIWSLNLMGIILGEFMNRFCLMIEEYFHLYTRYSGSKKKMFCACFNDVSFRTVLLGTLVAFIIISTTLIFQGADYFKLEYIEVILSGVGSSSLILYLLSLDSLSRVQISSLMENSNRLVANGLAWSFYFGYLKIILPDIQIRIGRSDWSDILSSKKLFILLPRDCIVFPTLNREDKYIQIVPDGVIEMKVARAGVYRIYRNVIYKIDRKGENSPLFFLAQYASPLCSLFEMSHSAQAKLNAEDRDEQAKLFLRTLEAILEFPSEPEVCNDCKLVPYARNTGVPLSEVLAKAVLDDMSNSRLTISSELSLD